jgi:hypothetical protein
VGDVEIRVQARASREGIAGERGGAIVIRVTAPPVEGGANEAVRKLIAKRVPCRGAGLRRHDFEGYS